MLFHFRVFEPGRSCLSQRLQGSKARKLIIIVALFLSGTAAAFPDSSAQVWADKTLKALTLREKIAQLAFIRVPGKFLNRQSEDFRALQKQIRQNRVGGLVLFAGNIYESAMLLNDLQSISKVPLLVAADFERGAAFRIADTTSFPWAMAIGATRSEPLAYQQGVVTGRESRALGVHWIFAPVMDVNSNPNNPVINIRAFSEDPRLVAQLGSAFIRGAKSGGVLTTAKHFPGHGDTATDSHLGLAVVQSDMDRLNEIELVPFRSAIAAGVDSIMTAHVAVPNVTKTPKVPATLSPKILTDLLRGSLNFKGIVVTDALEMGGITNSYWSGLAAIRAIEAGADILLLPADADVAISEVERAVKRRDITEARIDESVKKILAAKGRLRLHRKSTVSTKRISEIVATPKYASLAQELADRSITVLRNEPSLLPLDPASYPRIFSLALTPDLESSPASVFQSEMRRRFPLIRTLWANARMSDEISANIDRSLTESDVIVCSMTIRLSSGQNPVPIPENQRAVFQKLLAANKPLIWVAFGTPYVFQIVPRTGTHICTFSYSETSQIAAAKAIAGEMEVTGRIPVSIPGYSKFGDGLTIPKQDMRLEPASAEALSFLKSDSDRILELLNSFVENGTIPGVQLIVGHKSKILLNQSAGRIGFTESSRVSLDTVYDVSSLSRIVAIAPAAMMAADAGSLILQTPVEDYLPEVKGTAGGQLLLQDLLKLLADGNEADREGLDSVENTIKTIVARSTGTPYESFIAERLFKPLGMKNAFFKPPRDFSGTVARSSERQNAGLFCSAQHLALFAQMLLNGGVYNHRRYLKLETTEWLTSIRGPWSKPSISDWTGRIFSPNAYGCNSASGTLLWIDPAKKLFIILLTNGRTDNIAIPEAQRQICETIVAVIPS